MSHEKDVQNKFLPLIFKQIAKALAYFGVWI